MTISSVAERIGTGPRAVMDAERGKPTTGIVVYAALLWLYDQLDPLGSVADPSTDLHGQSLEMLRMPKRVRKASKSGLDRDF